MDQNLLSVLALLRWAVVGSGQALEQMEWPIVIKLANQYQLLFLVLDGAQNAGLSVPADVHSDVSARLGKFLMLDQLQCSSSNALFSVLSDRGVDYAPLKGIRLKKLYPDSAGRPMGDIDILIRPSQREQACDALRSIGYQLAEETPHELVFRGNNVKIELHKCLIPPYNKDYFAHYQDDWSFFSPRQDQPHCYEMSAEHELAYLVTHFAKHYRDGGIGPIHLIDLYLFRRQFTPDESKVLEELKQLRLEVFYRNLVSTMEAWFGNEPHSDLTDYLTRRLFSNGIWGNASTWALAEGVKTTQNGASTHVRLRRTVQVLFPSAEYLKYAYPVLKKHPEVLPFVWIRRLSDRIRQRSRMKTAGSALRNTTDANVSAYREELEYVGLDYHFT